MPECARQQIHEPLRDSAIGVAGACALLVSVASAAITWLSPSVAEACSCAAQALLVQPQPGSRDVPIDTALRVGGYFHPDLVELEREDGTAVAFELREHPTGDFCGGSVGELLPDGDLEPSTVYVVRLTDLDGNVVEAGFETGTGRVPEEPLATPTLAASFVESPASDCGGPVHGCVALSGASQYELTLVDEGGSENVHFTRASALEVGFHELPECVRARARDDAGRYSEPIELCGDELVRRASVDADYENGALRCEGGAIGEDIGGAGGSTADAPVASESGGGCRAAGRSGSDAALGWWIVALLLPALRARRPRTRA